MRAVSKNIEKNFKTVRILTLLVSFLIAISMVVPNISGAQAWPTRQAIKFIVAYPPGGASDVTARLLSTKMSPSLGQTVVVENRPGANGIIALELVAKAPPDGYTILMANVGPNSINPGIYKSLPYDPIKDFIPVTLTSQMPEILAVSPTLPLKTVKELIAYAKANPGKLNFASAGIGAMNHLLGEQFKSLFNLNIVHVPYKGDALAITDLISGKVQMMFPTAIAGMSHVKAGRLRALAVTSKTRAVTLPDVPTLAEAADLPGYEGVAWGGVMVPAGTPPEIVKRLNVEINRCLKLPDVVEKLASLGTEALGTTPEEFADYLKNEIDRWKKIARQSNVKLD